MSPKQLQKPQRQLKRRQTRVGTFVGLTLICLFWNGIVSVFLWHLISGGIHGAMDIALGLFLTPFVLIGLALIFGVFYGFLALFNPGIDLQLDTYEIHLGDKISGKWRTGAGSSRIKKLTIVVEGIERVQYRQGTSTATDTSLFFQTKVFETTIPREIERGTFETTIPLNSMHSFESSNNAIRWSVLVQGEIPKWPDVAEEFALNILPARKSQFSIGQEEDDVFNQAR